MDDEKSETCSRDSLNVSFGKTHVKLKVLLDGLDEEGVRLFPDRVERSRARSRVDCVCSNRELDSRLRFDLGSADALRRKKPRFLRILPDA